MLLKIKLLFDVVFLIHFNFIIQHGDVDHKCEIQVTKTKIIYIYVNQQELFGVQNQLQTQ